MSNDQGIYLNAFPRSDSSVVQPYNFADYLHVHEWVDSKLKTSVQISVCVLQSFDSFFLIHPIRQQKSSYVQRHKFAMRIRMTSCISKASKLLLVSSVQVDLQKRFPMNHKSFVCQEASRNRGSACHKDSEQ